jgi:hypothetical protein
MDNDAIIQFEQGISGNYDDWHPPIMSWIWGRLSKAIPGALGMLILHVILYWSGLSIFIGLNVRNLMSRNLYLLIGFYPPAFMLLSTIVKDVAMATSLLFSFSLILLSLKKQSFIAFIPGIIFLGYGLFIRHNSIPAAFPLFMFSGFVFAEIYSSRIGKAFPLWKSIISGIILFFIVFVIGNLINNYITKSRSYPFQQIMLHDLVGISIRTKNYLVPDYLAVREQPSMKDLRQIYQLGSMKNLYWPDFTNIHFKITQNPTEVRDLFITWGETIIEHPRAYMNHRMGVFTSVLRVKEKRICAPYYYEETIYKPKGLSRNNGTENYYSDKPITNKLFSLTELIRESIIYRSWLYILLPLLLFTISVYLVLKSKSVNRQIVYIVLTLSTSGLLYGLTYFFVATACDFRMFYWSVIVSLISTFFLISSWCERWTVEH